MVNVATTYGPAGSDAPSAAPLFPFNWQMELAGLGIEVSDSVADRLRPRNLAPELSLGIAGEIESLSGEGEFDAGGLEVAE